MTELALSVGEPFTSPAWGSNFVLFCSESGEPIPEQDSKAYISKACKYAQHYGVYLVPERIMLLNSQCMCLISPEGRVIGAQRAAFLNLANRQGERNTDLEVFRTEFGGIFLCVDVDIYHPEVPRLASAMGAQILLCSQQFLCGDYSMNRILSGAWNAAQSNPLFVAAVSNQFCCVTAPLALTIHKDGFVVPPNLKLPMTAKLNASKLANLRPRFPLARKLYAVHREDLIGIDHSAFSIF